MTPLLDPDLERWIQQFRGPLIGLLASWGAHWGAAEELAMDTFAEAWLARDRMRAPLDDPEAVGAWLRGIAFHLLQGWLRQRARDRRSLTAITPADEAVMAAPAAMEDERTQVLRIAFARLRPEYQEVLRMHYLEATSAREVAALLGVTQKAVEGRLYQARRALRALAERSLRVMGGRT